MKLKQIRQNGRVILGIETPQGVMHGYPAGRKSWLKPGDTVTVTIEGIGTVHNSFRKSAE